MMPLRIRKYANSLVTDTDEEETFSVYYRANTAGALRRLSISTGFSIVSIRHTIYHPLYFMFSTMVYRCATAVERFVFRWRAFSHFRHQIFCHLRRPVEIEDDQIFSKKHPCREYENAGHS
jgi:hypothetical protein